ncbi:MAG: phosphatase PAP2 family protein [Devosiaceae bacterium]|nr:phosphatase PAP2 family protein [Devosiaceae bacterium]
MKNEKSLWPFGFNRSNSPYFIGAAILVLGLLLLIDGFVTLGVDGLPEQIIAPFKIITRAGNSDWILIPTLLGTIIGLIGSKLKTFSKIKQKAHLVFIYSIFIFSSVAIPGIVANLIKRSLGRARPVNFEEYGILYFQPFSDWTFQSFPSGDTTTIFALFVALTFLLPKFKWIFLVGAILVALSRIMVGVHFPTDIFGGFILGTFGAYAVRNFFMKKGWISH